MKNYLFGFSKILFLILVILGIQLFPTGSKFLSIAQVQSPDNQTYDINPSILTLFRQTINNPIAGQPEPDPEGAHFIVAVKTCRSVQQVLPGNNGSIVHENAYCPIPLPNGTRLTGIVAYRNDSQAIQMYSKNNSFANITAHQVHLQNDQLENPVVLSCSGWVEGNEFGFVNSKKGYSCSNAPIKNEDTEFIVEVETYADPDEGSLGEDMILGLTATNFPLVQVLKIYYQ